MIRTRVFFGDVELRPWWKREAPDLLTTPADRALDAVGLACADFPAGSVIEYELQRWDPHDRETEVQLFRWEIVTPGWFVDENGQRHEKPGSAEVRVHEIELLEDSLTAVGIAEGFTPTTNFELEIAAWQRLIDTGMAWKLQGWFGRRAHEMISLGFCRFARE